MIYRPRHPANGRQNDGRRWCASTDYNDPERPVNLWTTQIGEVFEGEVIYEARAEFHKPCWWARVNNHRLGGYPTAEQAKAVVDRQIWNYALSARNGLKCVKSREQIWKVAFNFPPRA